MRRSNGMETLESETRDGVAIVRLARPPVNAVSRLMMRELRHWFEEIAEDRTVQAVVLSARGTKAFCAGIDLHEQAKEVVHGQEDRSISTTLDSGRYWRDTQHAVRHCPVPVIAAVDGPAIGAGFGLVGVCDLIIASDRATFALTEINVGRLGGSSKALRMVGPFKARMMFFSGDPLPASELYRLGAVEEIVDAGQAEASAVLLGMKLASKSPIALRLAKESILRIEDMPLEEAYRMEQDYTQRLKSFHDSDEALLAFVEKRSPTWTWS
jgi:enoyl-CoA hydratase